jgi:HNH endonuclease
MTLNGNLEDIAKRFWKKVVIEGDDDCWIWTAATTKQGYGTFWPERRTTRTAHSVAFELEYGYKPEEDTHHTCETKLCCNPNHLEDLTKQEHGKHSVKARQTHCSRGHKYTEENTYVKPNGCRDCIKCRRIR